jgi:hypothetical protein
MGFRRSDLQEAFFVPGSYPFRVWGYGTTDPLEDVLGRDYFRAAGGLMHPGDLIYVSMRPPYAPGARPRQQNVPVSLRSQVSSTPGDVRMALVMVRTGENGAPSVRLVQDFGCPDDPDAPSPPSHRRSLLPQRRRRRRPSAAAAARRGARRGRRRRWTADRSRPASVTSSRIPLAEIDARRRRCRMHGRSQMRAAPAPSEIHMPMTLSKVPGVATATRGRLHH